MANTYRFSWFRIPWNHEDPSPRDVMGIISLPLLTSLCGTMASLNVLMFIKMYEKCFSEGIVRISRGTPIVAAVSFMLFVLAIVYGHWVIITIASLLHNIAFIMHMAGTVRILRSSALESRIDRTLLLTVRSVVSVIMLLLLVLTVRLALVSSALTDATIVNGKYWDVEFNRVGKRRPIKQTTSSDVVHRS